MKTLITIQTLAKIGKILSKIIFICCIVGFCGCIVGIVSLAIGAESLKLGGGNPFTLRGAKELMRLGILTVAIPLGTVIVCAIGVAIADVVYPGIDKLSVGEFSSVGLGVMMIVLSLFCRYGAELKEGKTEA